MNQPVITDFEPLHNRLASLKLLKDKELATRKPSQTYIDDLNISIGHIEQSLNKK